MDRRQIGMKLIVDGLGLPFQINTFGDRLILQKAVYLAQAVGVNLGYYYHWYLRGPYCPPLTRDVYAVVAEIAGGTNESEGWELDEASSRRLQGISGLVAAEDHRALERQVELSASVHFLVDRRQVFRNRVGQIMGILTRFGKDFTRTEIETALKGLIENGLLPKGSSR